MLTGALVVVTILSKLSRSAWRLNNATEFDP